VTIRRLSVIILLYFQPGCRLIKLAYFQSKLFKILRIIIRVGNDFRVEDNNNAKINSYTK
jgi:hypothetical protein